MGAITGSGLALLGQDYGRARDLVSRAQNDLQRASEFARKKEKERERFQNAQHHLSDFDRELAKGHFDKGKLDDALEDIKNVLKNNTLESGDRDTLTRDMADLRTLHDLH
jgi:hypothetical protein